MNGEMTAEIAVQNGQIAVAEDTYAPQDVIRQVSLIQQVMESVMKKDEHYGVIPGTGTKPTLLKPGAEKLCLTFKLRPEYRIDREILEPDFIYYRIECTLVHITSGRVHGSGIGSCNSREEKYRWTNVSTGEIVPREYWKAREKNDRKAMAAILGADGKTVKKGGTWYIARRVENENPYDKDNTLLKMAQKRALVAAVLVSVAASDIFTQDLEDMVVPEAPKTPASPPQKPAEAPRSPEPTPDAPPTPAAVTEPTVIEDKDAFIMAAKAKEVSALFHNLNFDFDGVVAYLKDTGMKIRTDAKKPAIEKHLKELPEDALDKIIDDLNSLTNVDDEKPPERDEDYPKMM